jgi:hypothetical protein
LFNTPDALGLAKGARIQQKTGFLHEGLKFIFHLIQNSLYNDKMVIMNRWVKAGIVENRFEGDRVSQSLQEAGIPFLIKSFLDTAYDGLYIPQKGWGAVMVPENFRQEAERVISEVKKSFQGEVKDETE